MIPYVMKPNEREAGIAALKLFRGSRVIASAVLSLIAAHVPACSLLSDQSTPVNPEGVAEILGEARCESCGIMLHPIVTLGSLDEPFGIDRMSRVEPDPAGNWMVNSAHPGYAFLIYSPEGSLLRTFGNEGDGPGEFRRILDFYFDQADSLHVLDIGTNRISVFDPDLKFVRSESYIPAGIQPNRMWPQRDGSRMILGRGSQENTAGFPIHRLAENGERISFAQVFEPPEQRVVHNARVDLRRPYVTDQDTVLIGWPNRYRIETWHPTNGRISVVERSAEWFIPWQEYGNPFNNKPGVVMSNLNRDATGYIWVSLLLPTYWRPVDMPAAGGMPSLNEIARRYQTKVEILDMENLFVVADTVYDGLPFEWTRRGGFAYRLEEDDIGSMRMKVWRPELTDNQYEGP